MLQDIEKRKQTIIAVAAVLTVIIAYLAYKRNQNAAASQPLAIGASSLPSLSDSSNPPSDTSAPVDLSQYAKITDISSAFSDLSTQVQSAINQTGQSLDTEIKTEHTALMNYEQADQANFGKYQNAVSSQFSAFGLNLTQLNNGLDTLQAHDAQYQNTVQSSLAAVTNKANSNATAISTLVADIANVPGEISTALGKLYTYLENQITALTAGVNKNTSAIQQEQAQLTAEASQVGKIDTFLNSLNTVQVAGANVISLENVGTNPNHQTTTQGVRGWSPT